MFEFCTKCGSMLDMQTGKCPICGAEPVAKPATTAYTSNTNSYDPEVTTILKQVSPAPVYNPAPVEIDPDATTRVNRAPVQNVETSTVPFNPVPAQPEPGVTTILKPPAPPVPPAPVYNPASVQPDPDAIPRVKHAPTQAPAAPVSPAYNPAKVENAVKPQNNMVPSVPVSTPVEIPGYFQQLNEPVTNDKPAKTKKKRNRSTSATVLLSISFFIFLILAVSLFSIRIFASEQIIVKTVQDAKFSELAEFIDDEEIIVFKSENEVQMFSEAFYANLQEGIKLYTGKQIDQKQLKKILDKSDFMDFLGEKVFSFVDDLINDNDDFELEESELSDVFLDNMSLIEKELNLSLASNQKRELSDQIAEMIVDEDMIDAISPENLKDEMPDAINAMQIMLSWLVAILLALVSLFIAIIMFRNDSMQAAMGIGLICTVIGGITSLMGTVFLLVPVIADVLMENGFLGAVVRGFFSGNILLFVGLFVVGIVCFVFRSIKQKRSSK